MWIAGNICTEITYGEPVECRYSTDLPRDLKPALTGNTSGRGEQVLLDEHNNRRRHHGVPDLRYDTGLAATALAWCRVLARDNKFEHSDQNNYVER